MRKNKNTKINKQKENKSNINVIKKGLKYWKNLV